MPRTAEDCDRLRVCGVVVGRAVLQLGRPIRRVLTFAAPHQCKQAPTFAVIEYAAQQIDVGTHASCIAQRGLSDFGAFGWQLYDHEAGQLGLVWLAGPLAPATQL